MIDASVERHTQDSNYIIKSWIFLFVLLLFYLASYSGKYLLTYLLTYHCW